MYVWTWVNGVSPASMDSKTYSLFINDFDFTGNICGNLARTTEAIVSMIERCSWCVGLTGHETTTGERHRQCQTNTKSGLKQARSACILQQHKNMVVLQSSEFETVSDDIQKLQPATQYRECHRIPQFPTASDYFAIKKDINWGLSRKLIMDKTLKADLLLFNSSRQ